MRYAKRLTGAPVRHLTAPSDIAEDGLLIRRLRVQFPPGPRDSAWSRDSANRRPYRSKVTEAVLCPSIRWMALIGVDWKWQCFLPYGEDRGRADCCTPDSSQRARRPSDATAPRGQVRPVFLSSSRPRGRKSSAVGIEPRPKNPASWANTVLRVGSDHACPGFP